jgi:hypothetical protein
MPTLPALEQPDGLRREPRAAGQIFLGDAGSGPVAPQQIAELYVRAGLQPSHIPLLSRATFSDVSRVYAFRR